MHLTTCNTTAFHRQDQNVTCRHDAFNTWSNTDGSRLNPAHATKQKITTNTSNKQCKARHHHLGSFTFTRWRYHCTHRLNMLVLDRVWCLFYLFPPHSISNHSFTSLAHWLSQHTTAKFAAENSWIILEVSHEQRLSWCSSWEISSHDNDLRGHRTRRHVGKCNIDYRFKNNKNRHKWIIP